VSTPELSIVLPCYNESAGLAEILRRFEALGGEIEFELILVDNGSRDDTQAVLQNLLPSHPFARSVHVPENLGYGHGISQGLKAARGAILAWSHADLQTDPVDVFRAAELLRSSAAPERTIVKGYRHGRALGDRIISRGMQVVALLLLRRWIPEINAQPKVFSRELMPFIPHPPDDFNFDIYVLYRALRNGWTIRKIDVEFPPRRFGVSHWAATWKSKCRTILRSKWFMLRLGLGLWQ